MLTIALTGGIASGKTTVSNEFVKLGASVIDADVIAREVVEPKSHTLNLLVENFDDSILNSDGSLNRAVLRKIIFSDGDSKKIVECILHPAIKERSEELKNRYARSGVHYLIHVIPLLLETGQTDNFDRVLVVDIPFDLQLERVMKRDSSSRESALAIINSQATREERLSVADDVILNTGTLKDVQSQVYALHHRYTELSKADYSSQ